MIVITMSEMRCMHFQYCYVNTLISQFGEARGFVGSKEFWKRALQFLDIKLIFIPLAFIILRLWSCILNILLYYMRIPPDDLPDQVSQALIYLSVRTSH